MRALSFRPTVLALFVFLLAAISIAAETDSAEEGPLWGPWQVLLPFDHPEGSADVAPVHPPEEELTAMVLDGPGPNLERAWWGKKGREVAWRQVREDEGPAVIVDTAKVDFLEFAREEYTAEERPGLTDNAVAYLYRSIRCDEAKKLPITLGSDDGCRVWLNGVQIHEFNKPRGVNPRSDSLHLDLKVGLNHLFVKVNNGGGAWGFQLVPEQKLTLEQREEAQKSINKAIDRGVVYLLQTQQRDGSWAYQTRSYRNGQTSLALYALLKSGIKQDHQAIQRGIAFLRQRPPRKTYSIACQILALVSTHNPEYDEWIEDLAMELVDWQRGDFGYPTGEPDLSNTQYGALGIWAAWRHGTKIPKRAWTDLARAALKYHNGDGGFGYRPGSKSTGAMTVAGSTVIAVCADYFGEPGFPKQWKRQLDRVRAEGLRWLGDNFKPDQNPDGGGGGTERWKHYYLYGLERLAAIEGLELFGEHNWYWEGAIFYISSQGKEGQWATAYGEGEVNTCFGLLFLNRATATLTGGGASNRQGRLYATDAPESDVVLRAKGDTPLSLWLSEIRPEAAERAKADGPRGEGLYLASVEYLADGETIQRIEADPQEKWKGKPYAIQHSFTSRGEHTVQLKLHFAPAPDGALVVLASSELKVRVDELIEDWMLEYPDDAQWNLALGERKTAKATSNRKDHGAGLAFDGLQSTSWVCKADDKAPALTIEFKKGVRIDRLLLGHAAGTELKRGVFDRATKIQIELAGKKDPLVFEIESDEARKAVIEFPRKTKVTAMTIRVLERVSGTKHPGCVGFSEVEFRLGEEKKRK